MTDRPSAPSEPGTPSGETPSDDLLPPFIQKLEKLCRLSTVVQRFLNDSSFRKMEGANEAVDAHSAFHNAAVDEIQEHDQTLKALARLQAVGFTRWIAENEAESAPPTGVPPEPLELPPRDDGISEGDDGAMFIDQAKDPRFGVPPEQPAPVSPSVPTLGLQEFAGAVREHEDAISEYCGGDDVDDFRAVAAGQQLTYLYGRVLDALSASEERLGEWMARYTAMSEQCCQAEERVRELEAMARELSPKYTGEKTRG